MDGNRQSDLVFVEDKPYAEGQLPPLRRYKFIAPGLLATMGNRLLAGRDFTWDDLYGLHAVAIVSETFARENWQDPRAALGRRIRETAKSPWREVVGVVSDERDDGVDAPAPGFVCWPLLLSNFESDHTTVRRTPGYVIRSARAGSSALLKDVGAAVWSVNPDLPLASVRTQQEIYEKSLARTSFALVMLSIAGSMAFLLGIAGIYGVISYSVSQRRREIGIRVALGADGRRILAGIFGRAVAQLAAGVGLGLAAAAALDWLGDGSLTGGHMLLLLPAVSAVIGVVGIIAAVTPARHGLAVQPVEALRSE
jgi:predicted lysophospholipase L1 biosynthesis ABC-type transport system permease subunit